MRLDPARRPGALVVALTCLFAPGLAAAGGGVLEINQTCAVQAGCFPGDAPGFPVTIGAAGSYRLTGNLDVTGTGSDAVQILASGVALDLAGFSIENRDAASVEGVWAPAAVDSLRVRGGRIAGFLTGIEARGENVRVADLVATGNRFFGVIAGKAADVRDCTVRGNGPPGGGEGGGIAAGLASRVADNTIDANSGWGILIDGDSTITGNVIRENTSGGILLIVAQGGTRTNVVIRDNVIVRNTGSAVVCLDACLVWANIIRQNTSGVSCGGPSCLVSGNVQ